ncbi:hypothetical protein KBE46_00340 [Candidatus Saccharibacteria bacterium]|jgi:Na+/H+ antiporter NhaD/arsenite permease-like protein|nr:hypothetical protein [Candidatus Saccharibacteria bacterium]MBP9489709.1 hypothetical protein [Candidatus Saccharibacteria bacterium]MBP9551974.1 hypothetical protein [Candidatus Saccharibacteria bacterium]
MEFEIGTFFMGMMIVVGGVLMVRYYKEISDNFVNGISSYDKVRLWGLGVTIFGLLFAFNIVQWLLVTLIKMFIPNI